MITHLPDTVDQRETYPTVGVMPVLASAAGVRASIRFLEFFAAKIRNSHTR
jgi:hypothetical protein